MRISILLPLWSGAFFLESGCAIRVVPPVAIKDVAVVYVTDYGKHSALIMPREKGRMVEYSYGNWEWYALNQRSFLVGVMKLLFTGRGAFGEKKVKGNSEQKLQKNHGAEMVMRVEVERRRVEELSAEMDGRYRRHGDERVYNPVDKMQCVPDDRRYSLLHNCNHETAAWLRRLGCDVSGCAIYSNFSFPSHEKPGTGRRQR